MPQLGSRKALLLAAIFAVVVVSLSTTGPGALLFTLLPLAALFVVLYFVVRRAGAAGFRDAGAGSRTAREFLDDRYARGETVAEDYGRMRSRRETP